VWLDSIKSVVVAMVVHELATNAIKYGALVEWQRARKHSHPNLVKLVRQERGGPEISTPQRKGFGSHLIERAFGGQLGTAQLVFNPQGVFCALEVAL
jgi:two-component sensor histidine kinase